MTPSKVIFGLILAAGVATVMYVVRSVHTIGVLEGRLEATMEIFNDEQRTRCEHFEMISRVLTENMQSSSSSL